MVSQDNISVHTFLCHCLSISVINLCKIQSPSFSALKSSVSLHLCANSFNFIKYCSFGASKNEISSSLSSLLGFLLNIDFTSSILSSINCKLAPQALLVVLQPFSEAKISPVWNKMNSFSNNRGSELNLFQLSNRN